jgi:hypothetical protein
VDAEGLWPDACLAKVVVVACHFVEHVAGALAERSPYRWRRNTVAAKQVASKEGAAEQVASEEGAAARVVAGAGVSVSLEHGEMVSVSRSRGECVLFGKVARSHL